MANTDTIAQKEVDNIQDLLADLTTKIKLDPTLSYINDTQYDQLVNGLNDLTINIYDHKEVSETSKDRLDHLSDVMTSMAALDFSKEARDDGNYNHLDYFAIGINLLRNTLGKKMEEYQLFHNVTRSIDDLIIITDTKGTVRFANEQLKEFLGHDARSLIGEGVYNIIVPNRELFDMEDLMGNSSFHLKHNIPLNSVLVHLYHKDVHSILVNMSVSLLKNDKGEGEGFIFIVSKSSFTHQYSLDKVDKMCKLGRELLDNKEADRKTYREALKMTIEELEAMVTNSPVPA